MAQDNVSAAKKPWYRSEWCIVVVSLVVWPIGIPFLMARWAFRSNLGKSEKRFLYIGSAILAVFLVGTLAQEDIDPAPVPEKIVAEQGSVASPREKQMLIEAEMAAKSQDEASVVMNRELQPITEPTPSPDAPLVEPNYYRISRVVDGDTIDVVIEGVTERVRLVGIDTPETVDPRKSVECFGKEASAEMTRLVSGVSVALLTDSKSSDRDVYGRLLRYVTLQNGTDVNAALIKNGYAYAYTKYPFDRMEEFKGYEAAARVGKKGLWADGVCVTKQPESVAPTPAPAAAPVTAPTPAPTPVSAVQPVSQPASGEIDCSADTYNCGTFKTHTEAQNVYDYCMKMVGKDVHKLDGSDNDGLACEGLPN